LPASIRAVTGAAAAMVAGSVSMTRKPSAAFATGRTMNRSPAAALPLTLNDMPANSSGSAAVPLPVAVTGVRVLLSITDHAEPLKRSS
jgi:hypothetical protein